MVIPYLSFRGNCEEAMKRYIEIFGGEIRGFSRFTVDTGGPGLAGKVMHMEASVAGGVISGSDQLEPIAFGDAIHLMVHLSTTAEAERCFELLAQGGEAMQRLLPHPPPDDGGCGALVRDRYGYVWILTAPNDNKKP